jgi:MFS family permease
MLIKEVDLKEEEKKELVNEQKTHCSITTETKTRKNTLDEYLNRVGYSFYHYVLCFIVCYIFFVDGCEMIITNLLLSSLQKDWGISNSQRSLLSSAVFFGFFTGSLFSGYFTNKYGRKTPSIMATISIWIFTSLCPYTINFSQLFMVRILVGIAIGIVVPGTTTIITESIPTTYRSFTLNVLWILYPLGIIYICWVSMFFISKDEDLDWRKIWFVNSYTSIPMIFMSLGLCESPRYLILKGRFEEAFVILNRLGTKNIQLSEDDKTNIINEAKRKEEDEKNEVKSDFNIKAFVDGKYLYVSLLLAYLWFVSSFISYGLLYILPKIFDTISKHDKVDSLLHMIQAMFILFPCPLFRGLISEWKVLGRKNAMIVGFAGGMIAGFVCIVDHKHLAVSSGMLKFFINTSLGIVSVYTSEVYPTSLRSIALGFGNSITRMGGILTPFICEYVQNSLFPDAPFYVFVFSAVTGVIACIALPFETMGMALDSFSEVPQKKEKNLKDFKDY